MRFARWTFGLAAMRPVNYSQLARQRLQYAAKPFAELGRAARHQRHARRNSALVRIVRHRDHLHAGLIVIVAALHVAPANIATGADDMCAIADTKFDRRLHPHRIDNHGDQQDQEHDYRAGENWALHFHGCQP